MQKIYCKKFIVKNLLLIPESQKKPLTESLLYKQIVRFFEEEKIKDKFEIKFISIADGIVGIKDSRLKIKEDDENLKSEILNLKSGGLPPKNFRSSQSWVSKEQINQMAESIVRYLQSKILNLKSEIKVIAYVRGSYLEAVRLASQKSGIEIKEIFSDDELAQLKKKGIRWMKIGLRMEEAFTIFKRRIKESMSENEDKQLRLPI